MENNAENSGQDSLNYAIILPVTTRKEPIMKYVCQVCGYVYDPAENWVCPTCGVGKSDFAPAE